MSAWRRLLVWLRLRKPPYNPSPEEFAALQQAVMRKLSKPGFADMAKQMKPYSVFRVKR